MSNELTEKELDAVTAGVPNFEYPKVDEGELDLDSLDNVMGGYKDRDIAVAKQLENPEAFRQSAIDREVAAIIEAEEKAAALEEQQKSRCL